MAMFSKLFGMTAVDDDLYAIQAEALRDLEMLAYTKADVLRLELERDIKASHYGNRSDLPVSNILDSMSMIHVCLFRDLPQVPMHLSFNFQSFVSGIDVDVSTGISRYVSGLLFSSVGMRSAGTHSFEGQCLASEGDKLLRIDIRGWHLNTSIESSAQSANQAIVLSAIKSEIELSRINITRFTHVYQQQMALAGLDYYARERAIETVNLIYKERYLDNTRLRSPMLQQRQASI
jgi:hypothetical protein